MNSDDHRAVITGIGIVAPNGNDKESYWAALIEGKSCTRRVTRFPVDNFSCHIAAEVIDFIPHLEIPEKHLKFMDRAYQFGVTAAIEAVKDAGLDFENEHTDRIGVHMGLGIAGVETGERGFHAIRDHGVAGVDSYVYQGWFPSACSGYISLLFGLHGLSSVLSTGCTSSLDAFGSALEAIRSGEQDIALVGGSEAPITPMPFNSFCAMRALSTRNDDPARASRPFDKTRDGFVLGEGSGVVVLESLDHARKRGARIYAELAGYATTSNAFHMTAPDPSGVEAARSVRLSMDDAGVSAEDVDYFCAHGSSTPLNEKAETLVIKKALQARAYEIPVSAIKSMIGHTLGSAGSLQAAACALAFERKAIPPTINYEFPDPDCDLDIVPNTAREWHGDVALSNSAGFSGKNSTIVLRRM
jgi:3-oxoacyl-[acyl-carrier-protein] synthase II